MSSAQIEDLQKEMEKVMAWFQESSGRLELAYKHLEKKFDEVSLELEARTAELKEETQRHAKAREQLKVLMESMKPGVLMVDQEGFILAANPSAKQILSYDESTEILGKGLEIAFPDHVQELKSIKTALLHPGEMIEEERWIAKAGGALPVSLKYSAILDHANEVSGALCTLTDLTPLKKLEEEVEQAKVLTALGEMAATVAHEIRNPLGGIGGYAGLLARQLDLSDPKRRLVDKIIGGVSSLNKIVSNLLFYTRKASLSRFPVNLCAFSEEVLDHIQIEAEKLGKEIELIRELPDGPVVASVDPEKLQQVLLNLFINALQALGDAGQIILRITQTEKCIQLDIQDNGTGMNPETMSQIFNPFYTTKEQGTGLGLAICKKLMDLHGIRMEVQSELNQGTTFSLIFPV